MIVSSNKLLTKVLICKNPRPQEMGILGRGLGVWAVRLSFHRDASDQMHLGVRDETCQLPRVVSSVLAAAGVWAIASSFSEVSGTGADRDPLTLHT